VKVGSWKSANESSEQLHTIQLVHSFRSPFGMEIEPDMMLSVIIGGVVKDRIHHHGSRNASSFK